MGRHRPNRQTTGGAAAKTAGASTDSKEPDDDLFDGLDDETGDDEEETPGGALGLPENAYVAVRQVVGGPVIEGTPVKPREAAAKARNYRVLQGGTIMYAGGRTKVVTGKIIADNAADLDLWRRQGIVLEEVTE